MDRDRARALAVELKADLGEIDGISTATAIFEAARRRFKGKRYADRVAETFATWHLRHVELSFVVAESYIAGRHSTGFVAARPIFETAMTVAWLSASFPSEDEQYPSLLTLIDKELVQVARRLRSPKAGVREKAANQRMALVEEDREFVDEAFDIESRGLPGLRSRIESAEKVLRGMHGRPSRLDGAYGYYRALSSYGHPTGFGAVCELDKDGALRERDDAGWELMPLTIAVNEMSLLFLLLVEMAGWKDGARLSQGFNAITSVMSRHLNELHRETIPPALLPFMEEDRGSDGR